MLEKLCLVQYHRWGCSKILIIQQILLSSQQLEVFASHQEQ